MKVLGTFPMGALEKYLKMENWKFRYFFNRYVGKVPKNEKIKKWKNESFRYFSNENVEKVPIF